MPTHPDYPDLRERIRQCPSLPTMPAIALNVLEAVEDPNANVASIARLIARDPALSSKILRTVNSSFYGCSQHISTISHALVLLGVQSVKTLILGFTLVQALNRNRPAGFDYLKYWRRSTYAATAARLISARIGLVQQEEAFLATLLNDIGMLVLDQVLGDEYGQTCARAATHGELAPMELQAHGISHAEAGGLLAEQWKLPPLLTIPIAFHHRPDEVEDETLRQIARLVELSGWCADVFVEEQAAGPISRVRQIMAEQFGVNEDEADALLSEVGQKTKEVASLFEIRISESSEYEAILRKASNALLSMTLQAQPLSAGAGTANPPGGANVAGRAEGVAGGEASSDSPAAEVRALGGREAMEQSLAAAYSGASGKALAFVLIQLDHLASLRNSEGAEAAAQVVRHVGRVLQAEAKPEGTAAQWDDDRLALLIMGTSRGAAASIAETIRRGVAARPVAIGDGRRAVSMSATIGVGIAEPGSPLSGAAQLVKATEMALNAALKAGPNCVRILCPRSGVAPAAA